jgi:hypothetical protein
MMLAELYAKNFNDLPEAEQTVLEICDQPRTSPSQLSVALHQLSEWHLKLGDNPDAARRALQMICNRLPGTHLAHMAQLRINQLPTTLEELHELRNPKPIPVPEYNPGRSVGLPAAAAEMPSPGEQRYQLSPESESDKAEAVAMANACVEILTRDPNDVPAREKFARVLAERLNKVEEGIEQLTLLLNLPEQPAPKRAEWLYLSAIWHITHRHDVHAGRKILQRLIAEFPQSPDAAAARRRIQSLDLDHIAGRVSDEL